MGFSSYPYVLEGRFVVMNSQVSVYFLSSSMQKQFQEGKLDKLLCVCICVCVCLCVCVCSSTENIVLPVSHIGRHLWSDFPH